jgi:hypothetical protein
MLNQQAVQLSGWRGVGMQTNQGHEKPDAKLSMTTCLLSANSHHSKDRQNQHKLNENHLQCEKSWVIVFCVRTTKLYLHGLRRDPNSTVFMLFCSLGDSL